MSSNRADFETVIMFRPLNLLNNKIGTKVSRPRNIHSLRRSFQWALSENDIRKLKDWGRDLCWYTCTFYNTSYPVFHKMKHKKISVCKTFICLQFGMHSTCDICPSDAVELLPKASPNHTLFRDIDAHDELPKNHNKEQGLAL